ncbi:HAMP domain-containing sensor histidine kinase [Paenibacillus arenosi]|uniref:histidine kinase n=1 Tax=Paenibacillus arenosi TaxID=2774142 RepID=A0ABR9AWB0_9BACL|nr:HAMP domain-containing sensor histidine kinase [Paenibacillus arenosi]MBD8497978.1 HAMP domain-containing protein [Paenibacillus arenosi]
MRVGIVWKLFFLTTTLCMLILATVYIGQSFFFKQYYENRKLDDIQANIQLFERNYVNVKGNVAAIQRLEQEFYRDNNTWITTLDKHGNLRNTNDFYVEIKLDYSSNEDVPSNSTIRIPLYNLVSIEEAANESSPIQVGSGVVIKAVNEYGAYVPVRIEEQKQGKYYWGNDQVVELVDDKYIKMNIKNGSITYLRGTVTEIRIPEENNVSSLMYDDALFMGEIKQFQADLLQDEDALDDLHINFMEMLDRVHNNVKYKLFIKPIRGSDGSTVYLFSMASLQPVDEAVQMLEEYYGYLIALVLLLVILVSFYYSKKIAKPLLRISSTTEKIANLDFSEQLSIRSKDEIGDLSSNINQLSQTLHSYIEQLQRDIEKEKQLENTRKEFIAGVSHELKTPLSIMKSCISILRDGVAQHKREHYFEAMVKEVDKMDLMIVDMLELAKFESGTYKMEMDVFQLDTIVAYICEQLSPEMEKKQLLVHMQLVPVTVEANQLRIEQVITNFMTNAIRYTPEGEELYILTVEEGEFIKVSIENKGVHIPPAQLDKVWDRFYRGDSSRQRTQGGTGLGLAISKNILELHHVPYGAENTEDGVQFYFYLRKC